jgi:hypothetical protein
MVLGKPPPRRRSRNRKCVHRREAGANQPGASGLARTFTGNFLLGPPGKLYGPFRSPSRSR